MEKWKKILIYLAVGIACIYLIYGGMHARDSLSDTGCQVVDIRIVDSLSRQYVTVPELKRYLNNQVGNLVGRSMGSISTQDIENAMAEHPMVRRSECYKRTDGHVVILISQRVPLLKVESEGLTYYIDTDRKKMPTREQIHTRVIKVSGKVDEHMVRGDIADMAEELLDNNYWRDRIDRIQVRDPRTICLYLRDNPTRIILGEPENYSKRMKKLKRFLSAEEEISAITQTTYRELDLRYHNQVIGRK